MKKISWQLVILIAVCAAVVLSGTKSLTAQSDAPGKGLIPSSATAAIFVRPQAIFNDPAMELVPREIVTALGKKELGVDPCECEFAMMLVDSFDDLRDPPGFAMMFKFASPQALNPAIMDDAEEDELRGKPLMRFGGDGPVVYLPNDSTIVVGMEAFIKKMMSAKGASSTLIDLVEKSNVGSEHVVAMVSMEPIRGFVNENLPPKDQLPPPLRGPRDLPDLIQTATLRLNFDASPTNSLEITAVDEAAAAAIDSTVRDGVTMGRQLLMGTLANEIGDDETLYSAVEAYNDRIGGVLDEMLRPKMEGNTLTYEASENAQFTNMATIGTLVGMLLPAVQQVREAARRTQGMNQGRQIALACLNYESAFRQFPTNITDDDGTPLLSWRVKILPFIEENALYEQFNLDEPWDSENNIKLVDQMPQIYASQKFKSKTKTLFLGFDGPGTIFETGKKITFGIITDGSSNTILCVEANPDAAIEWSKPADLPFDPDQPVTQVGDYRPGTFTAVLCDGSVQTFQSNIDWELFRNLIQRNDGNVLNW